MLHDDLFLTDESILSTDNITLYLRQLILAMIALQTKLMTGSLLWSTSKYHCYY